MNRDGVHRTLLLFSVVSAVACIAELLWLRSAQLVVTRPMVAVLFLPWLAAAASNLGVWYATLARADPTPINKVGTAIFWIVAGAFALAFLALYGWLLFGSGSG